MAESPTGRESGVFQGSRVYQEQRAKPTFSGSDVTPQRSPDPLSWGSPAPADVLETSAIRHTGWRLTHRPDQPPDSRRRWSTSR